jgi:hypothetical protein
VPPSSSPFNAAPLPPLPPQRDGPSALRRHDLRQGSE